jgi:hypothetical protein
MQQTDLEMKEAATFLSHGKNQDIGAPLLNAMAKELGLTTREFVDLVKCPLSTEDFLAAKKERLAIGLRKSRKVLFGLIHQRLSSLGPPLQSRLGSRAECLRQLASAAMP